MLLLAFLTAGRPSAEVLKRDPQSPLRRWAAARRGPTALMFEQSGGSPPPSEAQQADLKAEVQGRTAVPESNCDQLDVSEGLSARQFVSDRY